MVANNPSPAPIMGSVHVWVSKGDTSMQRSAAFGIGLMAIALMGCQLAKPRVEAPPVLTPANPVPTAAAVVPATPAPVSAMRAVALLDAVCGASLPNFGTIDAALRSNGITVATESNAMRGTGEEVSFRLQDGPGDGKTCAMTFASPDGPEAVKTAFTTLGAFRETPLGLATKYRGRQAIFIYDGPGQQVGGAQYYTVRLLSER
jgi:hypothetical protein